MRGWARARYAAYEAIDKAMLRVCADRDRRGVARHGRRARADGLPAPGADDHSQRHRSRPRHVVASRRRRCGRRSASTPARCWSGRPADWSPVKGHEYLIRAAGYLAETRSDVRVVIAGTGPREPELRALARALGVERRCLFVDPVADGRMTVYDLLGALDVFVLPSLSEGLPMALLEAMALGRPAVASAVGGIPEVIVDRATGLLGPAAKRARAGRRVPGAGVATGLGRHPRRRGTAAAWRRTSHASATARRSPGSTATWRASGGPSTGAAGVSAAAIVAAPLRAIASRVSRKIAYLARTPPRRAPARGPRADRRGAGRRQAHPGRLPWQHHPQPLRGASDRSPG